MGGSQTGRYGKVRTRISSNDPEAQRAANAEAPKIPDLLKRIGGLFAPHKKALIVTISLVLVSAGLSVFPPLLTKQAFDLGLFPEGGTPNIPVLFELVGLMVALWIASALLGVWQTWLTANVGNKVMGACASVCSVTCRRWSWPSSRARRRASFSRGSRTTSAVSRAC